MNKNKVGVITHKNTGDGVLDILLSTKGLDIKYNLANAMNERGLTQRTLSLLTGIRQATISDMCNGVGVQINKAHLLAIMITLRITDIREIIDIRFSDELKEQYNKESSSWKESKNVPESVMRQALTSINKK